MKNRYIKYDTYIYVCLDGACKSPVEEVNSAKKQLLM